MVQLTDKGHWAVEVPDDARNIRVEKYGEIPYLDYDHSVQEGRRLKALSAVEELPPGTWQFLFTTKGATVNDMEKVIEGQPLFYKDYERDFNGIPLRVFTAEESLQSLLRSKGLDGEKNYVIIQKQ